MRLLTREALLSFRRAPLLSALSITTIAFSLFTIGLFALVGTPYTFKFLWSPIMDRYVPPFLGRRRGWLMVTQIGLLLSIAGMSLHDPRSVEMTSSSSRRIASQSRS